MADEIRNAEITKNERASGRDGSAARFFVVQENDMVALQVDYAV